MISLPGRAPPSCVQPGLSVRFDRAKPLHSGYYSALDSILQCFWGGVLFGCSSDFLFLFIHQTKGSVFFVFPKQVLVIFAVPRLVTRKGLT